MTILDRMHRISQDLQNKAKRTFRLKRRHSRFVILFILRNPVHPVLGFVFLALGLLAPMGAQAQHKAVAKRVAVVSPWDVEAREYLGTPQSEAAVKRGLEYLKSRQEPDGHWSSGGNRVEVAITAICLMAYLASGHQPGRGPYGLVMSEAVDFLANSVHMDGNFAPPGLIYGARITQSPMYGHGFATLALSEVYGMTHRRDLKPKIEAAVKLIEDTQNQDGAEYRDGGWRYQPRQGEADISVTIVQVMALRGARNAGIKVSQSTIDRALAYMKRCANADGGFSYQVGQQQSGPARTGAGVLSLIMAGMRNSPQCQGGLRFLQNHPFATTSGIDRDNEWPYREHFYYAMYYVTQAMYQAGGDYWRRWYPPIRDLLVKRQDSEGSWSRQDGWSEAGPEYATAMSVLVLQVPAGLLPIYQK